MDFNPDQFPESDPTSVLRYRDRLYAVDLLGAAIVGFDFFTWLCGEESSSLEEVCSHFGFAARPADVLITLSAANGYLERDGERFRATRIAHEYLREGSPWFMGPYYRSLADRPVLKDMVKVLRSGKPTNWGSSEEEKDDWHSAMEREDFAEMFTAAMDCRGLFLGQSLAQTLDLSKTMHLLDVGGGSAIYACVLTGCHPHLKATVLEKRPVDRIARDRIRERGYAERVQVVQGDMFEDEWPADADLHLFSNVLHDWEPPEMELLLQKSWDALPPGGQVAIHEAILNEDKTGPIPVAEYSALLMNVTQGKCYSTGEFREVLEKIGFTEISYSDTRADRGVLTAVRP